MQRLSGLLQRLSQQLTTDLTKGTEHFAGRTSVTANSLSKGADSIAETAAAGGRAARFLVTGRGNGGVVLDTAPDLVGLARTHGDEVLRQSAELGTRRQSVSSAAYNRRTGEVFFGENNTHYVFGDNHDEKRRMGAPRPLHPRLSERMPERSFESWPAAICAETHAINKGMFDADLPESLSIHRYDRPSAISDFAYATVFTDSGKVYPPCRNCQVLLAGAAEIGTPGPNPGLFLGSAAG